MSVHNERTLGRLAVVLARRGEREWRWWGAGKLPGCPQLVRNREPLAMHVGGAVVGAFVFVGLLALLLWLFRAISDWSIRTFYDGWREQVTREAAERWWSLARPVVDTLGGPWPAVAGTVAVIAVMIFVRSFAAWRKWEYEPGMSPRETLRGHRRSVLWKIADEMPVVVPLVGGLVIWLYEIQPMVSRAEDTLGMPRFSYYSIWMRLSLVFLVLYGIGWTVQRIRLTPWLHYRCVHFRDVLTGRLPVRTFRFLERAARDGVLVADGGGYRFRDGRRAAELVLGRIQDDGDFDRWLRERADAARQEDSAVAARVFAETISFGGSWAVRELADLETRRLRETLASGRPLITRFRAFRRGRRAWLRVVQGPGEPDPAGFEDFLFIWAGHEKRWGVARLVATMVAGEDIAHLAGDATPAPGVLRPGIPERREFSDLAGHAIDQAIGDLPEGAPLTTARVLGALIRVDVYGDWERLWAFDPRSPRLVGVPDPDTEEPGTFWTGVPMTGHLHLALRRLGAFSDRFRIRPVPVEAVAVAMLWLPGSGAARAIMRLNGVSHDEVRERALADLLQAQDPEIREFWTTKEPT